MKTFKMYVKTVIYNEQEKILLLKEKIEDDKPSWDLPGATFTEEQSFDETVINNVQKEIGYYVYPGKIIGISDYSNKEEKEVNVIMEGTILNGELLLSKEYETHTWVSVDRLTEYPLVPWLKNYLQNNKNPFEDVENEIEEITNKRQRRREIIQEDLISNINSPENTEKINNGVKSSFSLLKDTIIRTFHPQEAKVTQTTPKENELYTQEQIKEKDDAKSITEKLNIPFSRKSEENEEDENLKNIILKNNAEDIIIEHDEKITENEEVDIIIDHEDIVKENVTPTTENKKVFDMNINRQENMKETSDKKLVENKVHKLVDKTPEKAKKEPEIKIIHKNEETPHIRKEKESTEKVSFNSENIKRYGWKERLNKINRTNANKDKKEAPRPKGQRK